MYFNVRIASLCVAGFACLSAPLAFAQTKVPTVTTQQGTTGAAGTAVVNQTTTVPVYTSKSGVSAGLYSSTTVTGGSSVDGAGHAIPNGTRGSTATTTYGAAVSIPLPEGKAGHR